MLKTYLRNVSSYSSFFPFWHKHHYRKQLEGGKDSFRLILLGHSLSHREVRARNQTGPEAEIMEDAACWFAHSLACVQTTFLYNSWPSYIIHHGLGLLHQSTTKTGQSDLRSLSMVICAFQVTLDYANLTILTNQDTPNSIYGELVNNRSVTNIIVFMVFGGIHHYNIWV